MNRRLIVWAALYFALMSLVMGQQYELTTLDFPGALGTQAHGINPQGDIVGIYVLADSAHGFIYRHGEWTTFDHPDAEYFTDLYGIGPSGVLVGHIGGAFWEDCGPIFSFSCFGDRCATFSYPGALRTWFEGISPRGDIIGNACAYQCPDETLLWCNGFVLTDGEFIQLNPPNSTQPWGGSAEAISPAGEVFGSFQDDIFWERHIFVYRDGDYEIIDWPPGVPSCTPRGITPGGVIAGIYSDDFGTTKGCIWDGEHFTSIEVPGATATIVHDISPSGVIVGRYIDADGQHGFLGRPCPDGQTCSQEP